MAYSEDSSKAILERQKVRASIIQAIDKDAMSLLIDDMLVKEKSLIEELIKAPNEEVMMRMQGEIKGIREFIKTYFSHMSIDTTDKKSKLY